MRIQPFTFQHQGWCLCVRFRDANAYQSCATRLRILLTELEADVGIFEVKLADVRHLAIVGPQPIDAEVERAISIACRNGVSTSPPDHLLLAIALRHEKGRPGLVAWTNELSQLQASA
jgi:hypothetical protein